jgi:hypothetical protein
MRRFLSAATVVALLLAWVLGIIVVFEMLRFLFGGSWTVEELILGILTLNLSLTIGTAGYLVRGQNGLALRIGRIDAKFERHLGWHRGVLDSGASER